VGAVSDAPTRRKIHVCLEKNLLSWVAYWQAHYINNRTMEVFRGLGGLAQSVEQQSPPLELWRKFVYCESLTGQLLGSVDHFEVTHVVLTCQQLGLNGLTNKCSAHKHTDMRYKNCG
jgi:FAD binding domain